MRVWYTSAELAALSLPGLPGTKRNINHLAAREGWALMRNAAGEALCRPRAGRGGGVEFHVTLLPEAAQAFLKPAAAPSTVPDSPAEAWAAFDRLPAKKKDAAKAKLAILQQVETLAPLIGRTAAVAAAADEAKVSRASVYEWFKAVSSVERANRLPYLAPRHQGGQSRVEVDNAVVELYKSFWLQGSQPSAEKCWRSTARLATAQGITMPPLAVLRRRVKRDVPPAVEILYREGPDALKAAYPHQTRDRSGFFATEAMCSDTHNWDVMVEWPDGTFGRPAMVGISDLYSGKLLAWRIGRSENSEALRITFVDAFRAFGVPQHLWIDNGAAYASKQLTGGQKSRYRFTIREEDPQGMLTMLGVQAHFTQVYAGQSKPIERAWRDMAHDLAKDVAFAGAYLGHNTVSKPHDYGSHAVPLDTFIDVITREIAEWNARPKRKSQVCAGVRSFDEAFTQSYEAAAGRGLITRATEEQLRLCLLSSKPLTCAQDDGAVTLLHNRYHDEALLRFRGQTVQVRFDPEDLHGEIFVYDMAGAFVTTAACILKAGFADVEAGRRHGRARRDFIKATKQLAKAERRYNAEELAAMRAALDTPSAPIIEEPKIVRPVFGALALQARALPADEADTSPNPQRRDSLDRLVEHRAAHEANPYLRVVTSE
ncbi:hypothetical protein sos41_31600 [Alphaproteobacteria bacterium SO-S41]|nr:hypothetical protein sos41_31600 [Alphaproteobacteria bacterium SO-S41]